MAAVAALHVAPVVRLAPGPGPQLPRPAVLGSQVKVPRRRVQLRAQHTLDIMNISRVNYKYGMNISDRH